MKEGYKMTELGEIPVEWEVSRLDTISTKITDGSHYSPEPTPNTGYLIATVKDMLNSSFNLNSCVEITSADFDALVRNGCKPSKDDILFSKDGTIGKVFVFDGNNDIVLLSSIALIRLNGRNAFPQYVGQVLKSHIFYNQLDGLMSGSAIRRLVLKAIKSIKLPLPPLAEQQKIATILSTVDEKIEVIEAQISQTQELKKGLMQKLLTEGIGHTRFKDSELGSIPESWEVVKLGEVSTSFSGGTPSRRITEYYENGTIPWVKSGEVNQSNIENTEERITEKAIRESSARIIKPNSILVALYGATAGNVGRLRIEAASNQAVLAINSKNSNISNDFIYHYLKQTTKELISLTQGSGQPNLSKSIIVKLEITVPSKEEQKQIVDILTTIDSKLEVLESKKQHYQDLKKGLMQQLLTGKIRVLQTEAGVLL